MLLTRGRRRAAGGFFSGFAIGSLGGMIGLGGAEFRLPLLVGFFRLKTLEAIILNKATSLVGVGADRTTRVKLALSGNPQHRPFVRNLRVIVT